MRLSVVPFRRGYAGDGLSDGEEVEKWHTDPLAMDTDSDGLTDGEEVSNHNSTHLPSNQPTRWRADGGALGHVYVWWWYV